MPIFSLIFSIFSAIVCWYPFWSLLITLPALIVATVMFYKYFISVKKEQYTKGKEVVFSSFITAFFAMVISTVMAGTTLAIFLLMVQQNS